MTENPVSENNGPLKGIKVVDMSTVVLGPYAGQILGDLGAEVIRVESPASDMTRWAAAPGSQPGYGAIFMACNRNKRSLCLDLKKPGAADALAEVVKTADVFLHNVRLKAIEKLGFGYDAVKTLKPDIIYVHAVGYGSDGPYAGRPAYDDLVQAASGAASLNHLIEPDQDPRYLPTLAADKTSGLHAAYATLAALFHRERTGEGQFVEVPMLESFSSFLMIEHLFGQVFDPPRGPVGYHRLTNHNRRPFRTKDGFMCIMPYSPDQWRRVLSLGGLDVADDDPRLKDMPALAANVENLYGELRRIGPTRSSDDWFNQLSEDDIPVMKVASIRELQDNEHLKAINFFERHDHPVEGTWVSMRHPVKFEKSPASMRRYPPGLGEHSREVLRESGISDDVIEKLVADGALLDGHREG